MFAAASARVVVHPNLIMCAGCEHDCGGGWRYLKGDRNTMLITGDPWERIGSIGWNAIEVELTPRRLAMTMPTSRTQCDPHPFEHRVPRWPHF